MRKIKNILKDCTLAIKKATTFEICLETDSFFPPGRWKLLQRNQEQKITDRIVCQNWNSGIISITIHIGVVGALMSTIHAKKQQQMKFGCGNIELIIELNIFQKILLIIIIKR